MYNILYAYELSHDTTDYLYCIYNDQNQMVATVSRAMRIRHGHARYTIYTCNEEWFKYISLITLCWSLQHTAEDGSTGTYSRRSSGTLIPELHEKYNPTFIDQVKRKEGFQNLPENMQLVREKVKQANNGPDVRYHKRSWLILLILFILFILFFWR